ncbi:TadE/TadG family type IV pilus assembly protein [Dermatophilaceae bacterium Soc4.6]
MLSLRTATAHSRPTARGHLLRGERTRGAAAVEAALVLPVVIALFVGIVEFGLIFKDALAISSAVRAGGRMASAEPLKRAFATDAATQVGLSMAAVNTTGAATLYVYDPDLFPEPLKSCNGSSSGCLTFSWSAAAGKFGIPSGAWDKCNSLSTKVALLLSVQHKGMTSVPYASPTLTEKAVFAFEPTSTTALCQ